MYFRFSKIRQKRQSDDKRWQQNISGKWRYTFSRATLMFAHWLKSGIVYIKYIINDGNIQHNEVYHRLKSKAGYMFEMQTTVYPKKYAHGFVVLCFVVVMQSSIMNSHEVFIHIHQGCFAGTGAIVRLPQCQWSKPDGYGKISQCITTTKHSTAKTVCIFLGIYCIKICFSQGCFKVLSLNEDGNPLDTAISNTTFRLPNGFHKPLNKLSS